MSWFRYKNWIYPIGECDVDSTRKCPYRYQIGHYGNIKVDSPTIVECCRFERQARHIKEIFERQKNESNNS